MPKRPDIAKSIKVTRERRAAQDCVVYTLKVSSNKLSSVLQNKIDLLFLEAKWLYNHIIGQEDVFSYNTKAKVVQCLTPSGFEDRALSAISAQIKQSIKKRIMDAIKGLSAKKKKGRSKEVGKLKFKPEITSIPLVQFGKTYRIKGNYVSVENLGKLKVKGIKQLEPFAKQDIANANLIKRHGDLYIQVTCFKEKHIAKSGNFVGIDFGIKDSLVLSNGSKVDTKIPLSKRVKKEQQRLSKKVRKSKNWEKQRVKLQKAYKKVVNKRKEVSNQIKHHLKYAYSWVGVQDESIKGWHAGLFGKQIQQSVIGGIMAGIKQIPHTHVVDRWYASTQECPNCLTKTKQSLDKRVYNCSCGYSQDRDIHSARNILMESLEIVPTERRDLVLNWDKKPVENNTSVEFFDSLKNLISAFCESGS